MRSCWYLLIKVNDLELRFPKIYNIEPPTNFSKKGGLTGLIGSQFLEEVAWKEGNDFFQGGGVIVFT